MSTYSNPNVYHNEKHKNAKTNKKNPTHRKEKVAYKTGQIELDIQRKCKRFTKS